jgi:hypothetical protein
MVRFMVCASVRVSVSVRASVKTQTRFRAWVDFVFSLGL